MQMAEAVWKQYLADCPFNLIVVLTDHVRWNEYQNTDDMG